MAHAWHGYQCYGEPGHELVPALCRPNHQWCLFSMAFMGETTDIGVPELLSVLARRGLTGRLHISANSEEVQVFLDKGQVGQVSSSHHGTRIGRVLVRLAIVSEQDLDRAVRLQSAGRSAKPIGQILTEAGLITSADLARAAQEQATEALARVFGSDHGTFFFSDDKTREAKAGMVTLNAEGIVLEATRRADELATLRRMLPSPKAELRLDHGQLPTSGRLPENEQRIIRIVASKPTSIGDIVQQFSDDEILALRTILGLRERGILALRDQPQTSQPVSAQVVAEPAGVQPRSVSEITALMAAPVPNQDVPWAPSITEVRASAPAGSHTAALLTRTARDVVAAFNAGLPLLAFAHFSDEYFNRMTDMSTNEEAALRGPGTPLTETEQQTFVGLKDARTLADGRVSAIVVTRLPGSAESKKVVIFKVEGDRCLIDAIIESAQERERHTQTTLLSAPGILTQDNRVLRRHL
jgi:hypothetical protein